jgi:hypothetical protein
VDRGFAFRLLTTIYRSTALIFHGVKNQAEKQGVSRRFAPHRGRSPSGARRNWSGFSGSLSPPPWMRGTYPPLPLVRIRGEPGVVRSSIRPWCEIWRRGRESHVASLPIGGAPPLVLAGIGVGSPARCHPPRGCGGHIPRSPWFESVANQAWSILPAGLCEKSGGEAGIRTLGTPCEGTTA